MPGIAIGNCIPFNRGGVSWSSYWATLTDKVLFLGEVSKIDGDKLYNQVSGASDYLTVGGLAGNYTFECPDTAAYENADTDSIWFSGGSPAEVTEATLIGADYSSTPVKYDSDTPYLIRAIIIFKQGAVLTANEIDRLHSDMKLWIWWSLSLNANGILKGNRPIISNPVVSSAEIAQTVADKVVITFDQILDETSIPDASAFTLAGKTISNVAVSGSTVTLTVTVAYAYGDEVMVTYAAPESNSIQSFYGSLGAASFVDETVTNNLLPIFDGNTIGWYDYNVALTKDVNDFVDLWEDRLGTGPDLAQTLNAAWRPLWTLANGIRFNGVDQWLRTGPLVMSQPLTYYLVVRQNSWTQYDMLLVSHSVDRCSVKQYGTSPKIGAYAGTYNASTFIDAELNQFGVLVVTFNGASSYLRWRTLTAKTGDIGANVPDGICVGGQRYGTFSNIDVKELIARSNADDEATRNEIYDYLSSKYLI